MKLLHGTSGEMTVHVGLCLTDDRFAANRYANRCATAGRIYEVEIDMSGLRLGRVDAGFDDEGAPGDTREECDEYAEDGFDLIKFHDDAYGYEHTTWRIVSERAAAACRVLPPR